MGSIAHNKYDDALSADTTGARRFRVNPSYVNSNWVEVKQEF
jgi:hypothetical protein